MNRTIIIALVLLINPLNGEGNEKGNISAFNSASGSSEQVLLYLKVIQDNFSKDKWLVPAMEDNSGQTFNNAVTAMAFILTRQKERAERILNFYALRTDSLNHNLNRQNFFYNREPRGFYQNVNLNNPDDAVVCDRWMGDNAWLLLAFKYYEKEYSFNERADYNKVTNYLKDLLKDFYIDDPGGHGGFVRHGWRWGPRNSTQPVNDYQLHEYDGFGKPVGHEEGNIDAYAALRLCGENEIAAKIKSWLDYRMIELEKISGISLPLDLYSWRSLAFTNEGDYYKKLADVPENDPRFKKQVTFNGRKATGFFSSANSTINNVWLDGLGHMVCAFYSSGNIEKAAFYSDQLDSFLIKRYAGGTISLALPYTANRTGSYDWVDVSKGFSSACAWYIFAKNGFNPFTLEKNAVSSNEKKEPIQLNYKLEQNYPNPFNGCTTIRYLVPQTEKIEIEVYNVLGSKIRNLYSGYVPAGLNEVEWNGNDLNNEPVSSGVYIYKIISSEIVLSGKMILQK